MNALGRALLVAVLAVGVLGFGAMGLCGGFFTVALLTDLGGAVLLILSLPCLIGGFFMVWVCVKKIMQLLSKPQHEEKTS